MKRSFFDSVQVLDAQDAAAEKHRQAASRKDIQRSKAARSQTKVYSTLVECRILLQRSMTTTAEAPQSKKQKREHDYSESSAAAIDQCDQLLDQLLQARHRLTNHNATKEVPNYKKLIHSSSKDSDKDDSANEHQQHNLSTVLQQEYEDCRDGQWKPVLNRRHKDVRLHAGGGLAKKANTRFLKVLDNTFWEQVESTVQHEQLRHRQERQQDGDDEEPLVFDDAKVYQHLLKDFVSANSNRQGQEEAAQQRLKDSKRSSSKTKKDVDRRASKGRKLRYTEIAKLANFTFPVSRSSSLYGPADVGTTTTLDEDEWFRSLFGGAGAIVAPQDE